MIRNILAQATHVPWPVTSQWLFGMLGFVALLGSVFFTLNQARKLFGRTPPFHEEYDRREKNLRGQIEHAKNSAIKFAREKNEQLERRIEKQEELYAEMQRDRERKWGQLQKEINEVGNDLAYIRGKFEEQEKRRTA